MVAAVLRIARSIPPTPGGLEQHVVRVAEAQTRAGRSNTVVFGRGTPPPNPEAEYVRMRTVQGLPSDTVRGALTVCLGVLAAPKRARADQVLHIHGSLGEALSLTLPFTRHARTFLTLHGFLPRSVRTRAALRLSVSAFSGIFVVNEGIAEQLRQSATRLPPIYVVPSGVDEAFFEAPLAAEPSSTGRALMVGRLTRVKGFDVGLRAAELLFRRGVISGIDVVGTGPEQQSLQCISRELNVPVEFLGSLDKRALAARMRSATVLLVPSRTLTQQAEGSPTVIMEAWAAGLPVVATRTGGIPFLVSDGVDGVICSEEDPAAMAQAAADAVSARAQLITSARLRIQGHTWAAVAGHLSAAYDGVGT